LLIPWLELILRHVDNDFTPLVSVSAKQGDSLLQLQVRLRHTLDMGNGRQLPAGLVLMVKHHVLHDIAPLIVEFTLLFSWPIRYWRQRGLILFYGVVAAFFIIGSTTPFVLLGLLEIQLQELAFQAGIIRAEPMILQWLYFCEMGGNWLLAALAVVACLAPANVKKAL